MSEPTNEEIEEFDDDFDEDLDEEIDSEPNNIADDTLLLRSNCLYNYA